MTHYKMFTGPGTMFPGGNQPVRFPADFLKGVSNTVLGRGGGQPLCLEQA